ncbi:MAG: hypothetical protein JW704_07730 [Anaerolineaceae bacterium]|nr:hypothetical protein [Anaerolineaceae bacterium]
MSEVTITDMMQAYAQDAVDYAGNQFRVDLDFSENSLEQVEQILATLHNDLPKGALGKLFKGGPSQEQIRDMAKMWGGYVGEVIRQRWGGEWTTETAAHPGTVITLRVLGYDIFPSAKVHKRLTNGSEDNIWHYYQVIRQNFETAQQ